MPAGEKGRGHRIEPLGKDHDRHPFSCGIEALDRYLRRQAGQDARRRVAAPFVLVEARGKTVVGYYTLSQMGIELGALPDDIAKRLPRYPMVPATRLGRLAVDHRYQGQGLGEYLLMDAMHRSWRSSKQIASFAVVVDAKDDSARAFYERFEFRRFPEHVRKLFLPMSIIEKLFAS
jgi:GNAT superfamily N-acetyltransferase